MPDELLIKGVHVRYFDHHYAGENLPSHSCLEIHIDTSPEVCTSLLVNEYLAGRYLPWAVTAAFGDNMHASARKAAARLDYDQKRLDALCELGTCLNYNGYGSTLDDLHFTPISLYQKIQPYVDPFDFIENETAYDILRSGYYDDMAAAENIKPEFVNAQVAMYILPDAKWSRRVSGVFANQLAMTAPERAHAILSVLPEGGYQVSVRAPQVNKTGADELCRLFSTGGGVKGRPGSMYWLNRIWIYLCGVFDNSTGHKKRCRSTVV